MDSCCTIKEYSVTVFFAMMRPSLKPSEASMTSAIMVRSGAIIATGRMMAFKLSGSSVRPA